MMLDTEFFHRLFGTDHRLVEEKMRNIEALLRLFKQHFAREWENETLCLVSVPNRVELLGKHTDYQGGETLLLTGPKNFFAISAPANNGISELIDANPEMGKTVLKTEGKNVDVLHKGEGSLYTCRVAERLSQNLFDAGYSSLGNVKSVFVGDIPFGGGTSGSSAKVIMDFLIFTATNGLLSDQRFISLIIENGRKAGIRMHQEGIDDFLLALSMYLAHCENGLDFGDLKGHRGVGTFGGSEDHTAIVLGQKDTLLYCRYCPTEVIRRIDMPKGYSIVVAYSGRRAEKTKDAQKKYNLLSKNATAATQTLNKIHGTNFQWLRDFYEELPNRERAQKAYGELRNKILDMSLAERAYQFFMEREIIEQAVKSLSKNDIASFGNLINESHELSKKYLGNIVPEVDYLWQTANRLGALGATGFGAGFGGSCYAIVHNRSRDDFIEEWKGLYDSEFSTYRDQARFDVYPACRGCYWELGKGFLREE